MNIMMLSRSYSATLLLAWLCVAGAQENLGDLGDLVDVGQATGIIDDINESIGDLFEDGTNTDPDTVPALGDLGDLIDAQGDAWDVIDSDAISGLINETLSDVYDEVAVGVVDQTINDLVDTVDTGPAIGCTIDMVKFYMDFDPDYLAAMELYFDSEKLEETTPMGSTDYAYTLSYSDEGFEAYRDACTGDGTYWDAYNDSYTNCTYEDKMISLDIVNFAGCVPASKACESVGEVLDQWFVATLKNLTINCTPFERTYDTYDTEDFPDADTEDFPDADTEDFPDATSDTEDSPDDTSDTEDSPDDTEDSPDDTDATSAAPSGSTTPIAMALCGAVSVATFLTMVLNY